MREKKTCKGCLTNLIFCQIIIVGPINRCLLPFSLFLPEKNRRNKKKKMVGKTGKWTDARGGRGEEKGKKPLGQRDGQLFLLLRGKRERDVGGGGGGGEGSSSPPAAALTTLSRKKKEKKLSPLAPPPSPPPLPQSSSGGKGKLCSNSLAQVSPLLLLSLRPTHFLFAAKMFRDFFALFIYFAPSVPLRDSLRIPAISDGGLRFRCRKFGEIKFAIRENRIRKP